MNADILVGRPLVHLRLAEEKLASRLLPLWDPWPHRSAHTLALQNLDKIISNMMLSLFFTPSLSIAMSSQEEEEQDPIFDDDSDAASVVSTGSVTGITATAPAEDHCADLLPEVEESQLEEEEEGIPEATGQ